MNKLAYDQFRDFLEKSSGIVLGENKQYLVQSRLSGIMKDYQFNDLQALLKQLFTPGSQRLKQTIIDAMTTNETLWFRDTHPFEYFQNDLLKGELASPFRIWCAASSSGQEPYSLSICIHEMIVEGRLPRNVKIEIIATDISKRVLAKAREATYGELALSRGMSSARLKRHFEETEGVWKLKREISGRVEFKELNLKASYSHLGKFDLIFCRNVLIYFSDSSKEDILKRMHGQLKPGSPLILGSSESLNDLTDYYQMFHYKPGFIYTAK